MVRNLSEKLRRELEELRLVSDSDIDTAEMAETTDWSSALRGLWSAQEYEPLGYDIRGVANEILKRAWKNGAKPTNMWLNKVTWFVYERLLVEFGKLLTPARVEAWDHGPVFREVYKSAKVYKDEPIADLFNAFSKQRRRMEPAQVSLDDDTSRLVDEAICLFSRKSASQLRNLSHIEGSPWYRVWYSGQKTSAGMVISPNIIVAAARERALRR